MKVGQIDSQVVVISQIQLSRKLTIGCTKKTMGKSFLFRQETPITLPQAKLWEIIYKRWT